MSEEKNPQSHGQTNSEPVWLSQPITGLQEIAAMWPTGKTGLCREAEIPLRTFNAWIQFTAPITSLQLDTLRKAIHYDGDDIQDARPTGGCLLLADTAKNVIQFYEAITQGKKLLCAFEAVSIASQFDGYRVLIFAVMEHSPTTILVQRGGPAEAALNRNDLPGFQGPVPVPWELSEALDMLIEDMQEHDSHGHVGCDLLKNFKDWFLPLKQGASVDEEEKHNKEDDDVPPYLRIAIELLSTSFSEDPKVREHCRTLIPSCNPTDKELGALLRTTYANGFLAGMRLDRK